MQHKSMLYLWCVLFALDFFPNESNWRNGNMHIATDTLIAIDNAQRQNLPKRLKECITMNIHV